MPKKQFRATQIMTLWRHIEVMISQDESDPVACREMGILQ